jgi:WD40 repeat protein
MRPYRPGDTSSVSTPSSAASRDPREEELVYDSEKDEVTPRKRSRTTSESVRKRAETQTSMNSGTSTASTSSTVLYSSSFNHHRVQDDHLSSTNFAYLAEGRYLFSCGHWDWSVRVTSVDTGRLVQTLVQHNDVVTCLALTKDFGQRWLVTGSRDCTLIVWDIALDRNFGITITPIRSIYGHDDTINCVAINAELDIILSGSDDGTMMIHNLRDGKYVRSIVNNDVLPTSMKRTRTSTNELLNESFESSASSSSSTLQLDYSSAREDDNASVTSRQSTRMSASFPKDGTPAIQAPASNNGNWKVNWVGISKEGYIITYSAEQQKLATFSLNGTFLTSKKTPEYLYCFAISDDGKVLLHGGSSCLVVFRWVSGLG